METLGGIRGKEREVKNERNFCLARGGKSLSWSAASPVPP